MKINIVIRGGDLGWILGRLARELNERLGWTLNTPGADIDYCIPYYQYRYTTAPIKVPLLTHLEKEGKKRDLFVRVAKDAKYRIALSEDTQINTIKCLGYQKASKIDVIHLGSDLYRPKVFGVVGKDYNTGRKNFHWIPELQKEFNVVHTSLSGDLSDRYSFYNSIDYLIVTSSIEGGPVPMLDALAMGVPVVAPDTGWCWEYPCIQYEKDNLHDLQHTLRKLDKPRTWEQVAFEHKIIFEKFV